MQTCALPVILPETFFCHNTMQDAIHFYFKSLTSNHPFQQILTWLHKFGYIALIMLYGMHNCCISFDMNLPISTDPDLALTLLLDGMRIRSKSLSCFWKPPALWWRPSMSDKGRPWGPRGDGRIHKGGANSSLGVGVMRSTAVKLWNRSHKHSCMRIFKILLCNILNKSWTFEQTWYFSFMAYISLSP